MRRWAHIPPARPLPGAASARVRGGGWSNHSRASCCLSLRPGDMGSYLPAGASGKRLQMQEGCRRGFAHDTKRTAIARFFDTLEAPRMAKKLKRASSLRQPVKG